MPPTTPSCWPPWPAAGSVRTCRFVSVGGGRGPGRPGTDGHGRLGGPAGRGCGRRRRFRLRPLFFDPAVGTTAARLSPAAKNAAATGAGPGRTAGQVADFLASIGGDIAHGTASISWGPCRGGLAIVLLNLTGMLWLGVSRNAPAPISATRPQVSRDSALAGAGRSFPGTQEPPGKSRYARGQGGRPGRHGGPQGVARRRPR